MTITISLDDAKTIIARVISERFVANAATINSVKVHFIHKYSDGSGEADIDAVIPIERVDITFELEKFAL